MENICPQARVALRFGPSHDGVVAKWRKKNAIVHCFMKASYQ